MSRTILVVAMTTLLVAAPRPAQGRAASATYYFQHPAESSSGPHRGLDSILPELLSFLARASGSGSGSATIAIPSGSSKSDKDTAHMPMLVVETVHSHHDQDAAEDKLPSTSPSDSENSLLNFVENAARSSSDSSDGFPSGVLHSGVFPSAFFSSGVFPSDAIPSEVFSSGARETSLLEDLSTSASASAPSPRTSEQVEVPVDSLVPVSASASASGLTSEPASALVPFDESTSAPRDSSRRKQSRHSSSTSPRVVSFTNCHVFINLMGGSQRGFYGSNGSSNALPGPLSSSSSPLLLTAGGAASHQDDEDALLDPASGHVMGQKLFPGLEAMIRRAAETTSSGSTGSSGSPGSPGSSLSISIGSSSSASSGAGDAGAAPGSVTTSAPVVTNKSHKTGNELPPSFEKLSKFHETNPLSPYFLW